MILTTLGVLLLLLQAPFGPPRPQEDSSANSRGTIEGVVVRAGSAEPLRIAAGQSITGLAFHLTPAGTISGVVKDSSGEPLAGAQVQLLQSTCSCTL